MGIELLSRMCGRSGSVQDKKRLEFNHFNDYFFTPLCQKLGAVLERFELLAKFSDASWWNIIAWRVVSVDVDIGDRGLRRLE